MLKIRGHHFLCIEGFKGYGYSSEFVKNMRMIIDKLKKNSKVIAIDLPDDICSYCPHLKDGRCSNEKGGEGEVSSMDRIFFNKTGLKPCGIYRYLDVKKIIYSVFKKRSDLFGICSSCSWKNVCEWYISRSD